MSNTFKAFDPVTIYHKSNSTACEACYSRKVRCEPCDNAIGCRQCSDHGVDCKPRTRKRKVQPSDDGRSEWSEAYHAVKTSSVRSNHVSPEKARRRSANDGANSARSVKRANSIAVPGLFVNTQSTNTNEYSPESAAHSETPSHARHASYLSRSAVLGDEFPDIDHTHGDKDDGERKSLSSTAMKVLSLHSAFDLPGLPLRQSLVEAFLERCSTWMPVVDSDFFAGAGSNGEVSLTLLQSIILAGSLMRPQVCEMGFAERQYQRVKALIHSGHEQDPLMMLAALCVVQHYAVLAPKEISADMPRAWNLHAVGLAHQLGLHRASRLDSPRAGLRNRIWWTLVWRDNLASSCHGRPRALQPEDCTAPPPNVQDFEDPTDPRAEVFCRYVEVIGIMGDLCLIITRKGRIEPGDRYSIASRLFSFVNALPEALRLYSPNGMARPYNYDLAQLHVPVLITLAILFRPRTIHQLAGPNAASVTAAFLLFRIFEAIELREHTRYLASGYGWYFLTTAMPLLSCTKVVALREEANQALNSLESALETLGKVKPAAANNLRNVRAIRTAMASKSRGPASTPNVMEQDSASIRIGRQILEVYGLGAIRQYEQIADILAAHKSSLVSPPK